MLAPNGTPLQAQDRLRHDTLRQLDSSRIVLRSESHPDGAALQARDAILGTGATRNRPTPPARSDGARLATVSAEHHPDDTDAAIDREIKPSHRRSWPGQA
jgi:hypothetical protein